MASQIFIPHYIGGEVVNFLDEEIKERIQSALDEYSSGCFGT